MDDPKDTTLDRDESVKAWHEYGLRFSVFVPDHQPNPDTWEPDVEEFDEKGRVNPTISSTGSFCLAPKSS